MEVVDEVDGGESGTRWVVGEDGSGSRLVPSRGGVWGAPPPSIIDSVGVDSTVVTRGRGERGIFDRGLGQSDLERFLDRVVSPFVLLLPSLVGDVKAVIRVQSLVRISMRLC